MMIREKGKREKSATTACRYNPALFRRSGKPVFVPSSLSRSLYQFTVSVFLLPNSATSHFSLFFCYSDSRTVFQKQRKSSSERSPKALPQSHAPWLSDWRRKIKENLAQKGGNEKEESFALNNSRVWMEGERKWRKKTSTHSRTLGCLLHTHTHNHSHYPESLVFFPRPKALRKKN